VDQGIKEAEMENVGQRGVPSHRSCKGTVQAFVALDDGEDELSYSYDFQGMDESEEVEKVN